MRKLRDFFLHLLMSFNVAWVLGIYSSKGNFDFSLLTGFISLGTWLLFVLFNKEDLND